MKESYYMVIPAEVWSNEKLSGNEILLYGHITVLANKTGICFASNKYFESKFNLTERTIKRMLKTLEDEGLINRAYTYKEGSKEIEKRYITLATKPSLRGDKNDTTPGDKNVTGPGDTDVPVNITSNTNSTSINIKNSKKVFNVICKMYPKNRINSPGPILKYLDTKSETELKTIVKNIQPYLDIAGSYVKNLRNYLEHECWTDEWIEAELKIKNKKENGNKPDTKRFDGNYDDLD